MDFSPVELAVRKNERYRIITNGLRFGIVFLSVIIFLDVIWRIFSDWNQFLLSLLVLGECFLLIYLEPIVEETGRTINLYRSASIQLDYRRRERYTLMIEVWIWFLFVVVIACPIIAYHTQDSSLFWFLMITPLIFSPSIWAGFEIYRELIGPVSKQN